MKDLSKEISLYIPKTRFPNLENYDLDKPGEMALYLSYLDIFPFLSVIENSDKSNKETLEKYWKYIEVATAIGDFEKYSELMTTVSVHSNKVELYSCYSLWMTLVSLLEDALFTLCRCYQNLGNTSIKLSEAKGQGLEKATMYLKHQVGIAKFTDNKNWEHITAIRDARNIMAHSGGHVPNKQMVRKKLDKFGIEYDEQVSKICITHDCVLTAFETIIAFLESSFRNEPTSSTISN